ncbi:hypothetical protein [Burkholderia vietnamiensis]|uniref:hypothetical protein n=1 Tax=Burkholderia vietnamiensis TaxID=60552 RepID=UPI0012D88F29|nr:hypothetical protein [Burkholderia vietnamiensis]
MRDRRRGYAALAEIRRADGVISDVVGRCNNMSCGPADDPLAHAGLRRARMPRRDESLRRAAFGKGVILRVRVPRERGDDCHRKATHGAIEIVPLAKWKSNVLAREVSLRMTGGEQHVMTIDAALAFLKQHARVPSATRAC